MKKIVRISFTLLALLVLSFAGSGCTSKAKVAYHVSRANHYYDSGDLASAEIEYINALRYDVGNVQANCRLGQLYYAQGRFQRAAYFLGKGVQLAPDNLDLHLKLGFIYSSVGQFSNALVQANFVLDKKPQDDEAPLLLAEASVRPKDAAASRQRLEAMARTGDRAPIEVALGSLDLRNHDLAGAATDFDKARALDSKSPAVNAALGSLAWAQKDLKQADQFFRAAADASPARSPRRMEYVQFKMQTGDPEGARAELAEILTNAPDYVPASIALAQVAAGEKKYDESQALLEQALHLDEDNFDALLFQEQLDLMRGKQDQAVADMERMARAYPTTPMVQYRLGAAYLATGDTTKAITSLTRALELNPNYIEATLLLAEAQIRAGNADPAIIALEPLRTQQPKITQAQLLLAEAYCMKKRFNDALSIYQSLEAMYPTNTQVLLVHGTVMLKLGDSGGARKAFEHILEISPDHLQAIEQLVDLDISEKQFDAASQLIDRKTQAYPKQLILRLLSAKVLIAEGKREQAEAALQQAAALEPSSQNTQLLLAQLYGDEGQNDKALAKLDAILAKEPANISALMLAAKIYSSKNDYTNAAATYEKVLNIDPKFSPALNNLAYLYSEYLNNVDRAYDLAQRARDLLPVDPSTADTLGWIDVKRGSYDSALTLLKDSAAKMPNEPEIQFHLGMAAYMTADEATARTALQQAWQSGKDFPGRAECETCLSILKIDPTTADATARALLDKRLNQKPGDPIALNRLARIYQRDGNTDKAIESYQAVLRTVPKSLDAMLNLARLFAPKDLEKAYNMAKAASKVAPYDPQVSHLLGRLAYQSGDYHLATSQLQQSAQAQPNDPSILFDFARAAYALGRISDAQSALQSALGLNPPAAQAAQARQMLDMITLAATPSQAVAAGARIADILKSQPNDAPALMAHATASEYNSDPVTAEQTYEKILQHFPEFTPAQERLARLYATDPAKLDRAVKLAAQAHDTLPDDPMAAKTLGIVLFQRGDYSHAVTLLQQSAFRSNSDPEVLYYLGAAQFHLKNHTDSKANLQQALALRLSPQLVESAKQMLSAQK